MQTGGHAGFLDPSDPIDGDDLSDPFPRDPSENSVLKGQCRSGQPDGLFRSCTQLPCPQSMDCSGLGGGGAGGAAGAAGATSGADGLSIALCPAEYPPLSGQSGCFVFEACIEPPTVTDNGQLECCYNAVDAHCL